MSSSSDIATSPVYPSASTLIHLCRLAIQKDKPIVMDYWESSLNKTSMVIITEDGDRLLAKSAVEYTSPIEQTLQSGDDLVLITYNSIYVVSSKIVTRRTNSSSLT